MRLAGKGHGEEGEGGKFIRITLRICDRTGERTCVGMEERGFVLGRIKGRAFDPGWGGCDERQDSGRGSLLEVGREF